MNLSAYDVINYFIRKGLLWGVRPVESPVQAFEITDQHMKIIFYSYLSRHNGIVKEFLYGKDKPDIWLTMPRVNVAGTFELPMPHLLYRNLSLPPFTDEPLFLVLVDWDLYSYSRMSYARRVVRQLIEPLSDMVRENYLNLLIIDTKLGIDEAIGEILGGLILRSLGFLVDITSSLDHGLYLETGVSRKYPDIVAWKTEIVELLKKRGLVKCGAFLPELSVLNLYGPPPCQKPLIKPPELPRPTNLIVVGEVEPSYRRVHGGIKQIKQYDELGYADITLLIAPGACRHYEVKSCIELNPPLNARFTLSTNVNDNNRKALSWVLDYFTRSTLLLNVEPQQVLEKHHFESWHDIAIIPLKLDWEEILSLMKLPV